MNRKRRQWPVLKAPGRRWHSGHGRRYTSYALRVQARRWHTAVSGACPEVAGSGYGRRLSTITAAALMGAGLLPPALPEGSRQGTPGVCGACPGLALPGTFGFCPVSDEEWQRQSGRFLTTSDSAGPVHGVGGADREGRPGPAGRSPPSPEEQPVGGY
ncbi:hypothetical protein Bbelb_380320 [Branchiostoma belcheri]|nr:hypothetical protein Bbelb_380320 [Branchiostoma belcheri]